MAENGTHRMRVIDLQEQGVLLVEDGNHGEYRPRRDEFVSSGVAFIRAADMANGRVLFARASKINATALDRIRKGIGAPGDVILSHKGTVGKVALVPEDAPPFVCSPQTTFWRCLDLDLLDRRYLYAYLNSQDFHNQLASRKGETDMADYVSLTAQRLLTVPIPPISAQRRIADILGTLDDKIDVNRRMNETLETMARRLFRSWFVDFDPVHAKAALRREHPKLSSADLSRRALPNMAPQIAELFPDSFEDSTLGPIPKGWSAGTVPDAIEVNPSRSIAKGTVIPWLEMANMPTRSARALAWERREFKSGTKFINGDTLVARITPCLENGKTAFVDFLDDDEVGAGSTEYIVLRPKPPLPPVFAYLLARTDDFRQHLITNMTGTSGRQRAPADCLNTFPLVTPPEEIAECFARTTGDLFAQMKTIDEESFALTATRDRLLPRLLSGEIEVTRNGGAHEST